MSDEERGMSGDVTAGDLFRFMERKFDKLDDRLGEGEKRFDKMQLDLQELRGVTKETLEQAKTTNGRVTSAEDRLDVLEDENRRAADVARGRREQRADDLERIKTLRDTLTDFWPLALGAILGGVGVGSFLWGVFR